MGLFVYTQKGSIISMVDLPTTEIIEPKKIPKHLIWQDGVLFYILFRLTGRLAVVIIAVKPFAEVVGSSTSARTEIMNSARVYKWNTSLLAGI